MLQDFSKPYGLLSLLLEETQSDFVEIMANDIDERPDASVKELRSHILDAIADAPDGYFRSMINPETFPLYVKQAYDRLQIDKKIVENGHTMYHDEKESVVNDAVTTAINSGALDAKIRQLKN